MIAVYALCKVQADKISAFQAIVDELVAKSRQDQGCISYHCGKVVGQDTHFAFVEHWQSMADLQAHMTQPHFTEAGAKFAEVLSAELEISIIELG